MVKWFRAGAVVLGILVLAWFITVLLQVIFDIVSWVLRGAIAVVLAFIVLYIAYLVLTKLVGKDPFRSTRSRL